VVLQPGEGDAHWIALDAALAAPQFRTLEEFTVFCVSAPDASSMLTNLRRLMPLAMARGILAEFVSDSGEI